MLPTFIEILLATLLFYLGIKMLKTKSVKNLYSYDSPAPIPATPLGFLVMAQRTIIGTLLTEKSDKFITVLYRIMGLLFVLTAILVLVVSFAITQLQTPPPPLP